MKEDIDEGSPPEEILSDSDVAVDDKIDKAENQRRQHLPLRLLTIQLFEFPF